MSKVLLIIVGVIVAIVGILTLFPAMTLGLWLSIALIGVGMISIILGFLDKGKAGTRKAAKEVKQEEQIENKT
jgi:uncharacterized membrane protein